MAKKNAALAAYEARVDEDYILDQLDYHQDSDSFRDRLQRLEDGDKLYNGQLDQLFPDDKNIPEVPYIENKYKNALHDMARLASEGRGTVRFMQMGDKAKDTEEAQLKQAVAEGYWFIPKMHKQEHQLYLDLISSGMMAVPLYYDDRSPYPMAMPLNPRYIYPDVRNGMLQSLVKVERVKERVLAREFPHLGLDRSASNQAEAFFVCLYDDEGVTEAVVVGENRDRRALKGKTWVHELGCVPVAFASLDTSDRHFHGLLEQLSGPIMVRNKIIRFIADNLEAAAHAPKKALNVINADDPEGPETIYQLDPNKDQHLLERLVPAPIPNGLFNVLQYMDDQEQKEGLQPPSRSGNVSQSIASGSFVDRTQGQLTSVIKELQDKMASLRDQYNDICIKMERQHLDVEKPLYRSINGQKMYKPSEVFGETEFHEVTFGAGAGLDRLNQDSRVANHYTLGLISKETARGQIDYLADMTSEQEKSDRDAFAEAIKQRFLRDPSQPMSAVVQAFLMLEDGKSMTEALKKVLPDLQAQEQAMLQQGAGGIPEGQGLPGGGVEPGQPAPAPAVEEFAPPFPMQQVINRVG